MSIEIAGVIESINAVKTILGGAFEAKVDAQAKSKIQDAQDKLGKVQDTLFELRDRLFKLQTERENISAQLEAERNWADKAAQYELTNTLGRAVVHQFKGAPAHYACPSCFNKHEVHILQPANDFQGTYKCTGCGSTFPINMPKDLVLSVPVKTAW